MNTAEKIVYAVLGTTFLVWFLFEGWCFFKDFANYLMKQNDAENGVV